jgi:murein DD-endopeptidase MepM/ murein hydrolase activator NlpD
MRTREVGPSGDGPQCEHTPRREPFSPVGPAVHRSGRTAPAVPADRDAGRVLRLVPALVLTGALLSGTPPAAAGPAPAGPAPQAARSAAGPWSSPLPGEPVVTRPFSPPADPYGPGHRGVDLAAAPGSVIRAAGDGVVVFAGMVAGRPVVSIGHPGGLRTTYEPVTPSVAAGQPVARGSPIGVLLPGHPGCPAAACLHWGLRRGEVYLDPLLLLRPPRLRLLPSD